MSFTARSVLLTAALSAACHNMLEPIGDSGDRDTLPTDLDTREADTLDTDTEVDTDLGSGNQEWVRGDLTWHIDFDATAEAAGFQDCDYVRHYEAGQDDSRDWLCLDCDMSYLADVSFVSGLTECYRQLSPTNPRPNELIGRSGSRWMRARSYNDALLPIGTSTVSGRSWQVSASGSAEHTVGSISYTISGVLERSLRSGDTHHGWTAPDTYACGWNKADRPEYTGTYVLAVGRQLPDVVLSDLCDQPVRLHDLSDGYLIVYTAAADCVMCAEMAGDQRAFEATLAGLGWNATVVSILVPSLSNATGDVSMAMLRTWQNQASLAGHPILRDRGFAYNVIGTGFPTSVVVAPSGEVIDIATGYAGSWDYWGLQIDQHLHGED